MSVSASTWKALNNLINANCQRARSTRVNVRISVIKFSLNTLLWVFSDDGERAFDMRCMHESNEKQLDELLSWLHFYWEWISAFQYAYTRYTYHLIRQFSLSHTLSMAHSTHEVSIENRIHLAKRNNCSLCTCFVSTSHMWIIDNTFNSNRIRFTANIFRWMDILIQ